MILFAQRLTDGVIGLSALVLMNHHIDASFEQQLQEALHMQVSDIDSGRMLVPRSTCT